MAKGDDAIRKKLNKANRKKLRKDDRSSSSVTARVASIIAAKKRRQSGKRRKCQGMCFSLPTLEDPFNDRNGKKDFEKVTKKVMLPHRDETEFLREKCKEIMRKNEKAKNPGLKNMKVTSVKNEQKKSSIDSAVQKSRIDSVKTKAQLSGEQEKACESSDCPSKYLIRCLNEIENSLRCDGTYCNEEGKPLFVSTWGVEFWKCYSAGKDILETSGTSSTIEKIAWIVSSAADSISRKDEEGPSATSPFLLFLVASQEKAAKIRSVCKPLKVLGIHTVSIHPGASLDHQIQGLKSSEPEFMISTPERLVELLSLKAIDLSGVSWLDWACHSRFIRVMPNTPSAVGVAASVLSLGGAATEQDGDLIAKLFGSVRKIWKADEKLFDAITGLRLWQMEELLQVYRELELALGLASQTVLGAASMATSSRKHPGQLKDDVTSPGGTITGIHELEKGGFRGILMNAVVAAARRSRELSQN